LERAGNDCLGGLPRAAAARNDGNLFGLRQAVVQIPGGADERDMR